MRCVRFLAAAAGLALAAAAAALPPMGASMPAPVDATIESAVADWRRLDAGTTAALRFSDPPGPLAELVGRAREEIATVRSAMDVLASVDAAADPQQRLALLGTADGKLAGAWERIIQLQTDLWDYEEPFQRAAALGLAPGTSLDDLPGEIARVAWVVRSPETSGAWRVLLRLDADGGASRERARELARELEAARQQKAVVVHVHRGDDLAVAREAARVRFANAVAAIEAAGHAADAPPGPSGGATTAGSPATPTPLPAPPPDTSRLRGHLHLVRESIRMTRFAIGAAAVAAVTPTPEAAPPAAP